MDELKKMMAELVADRQKRDKEFAAERQRRGEAVAERTRRERSGANHGNYAVAYRQPHVHD